MIDDDQGDPLAAYRREIAAIEDGWFEELAGTEPGAVWAEVGRGSRWARDGWVGLRAIQERHGIVWLDDPRALSIAAFRAERAAIDARRERSGWGLEKAVRAKPGPGPQPVPEYGRLGYRFDVANCEARHFPRFDPTDPDDPNAPMDTLAKVWFAATRLVEAADDPVAPVRDGLPFETRATYLDRKAPRCLAMVRTRLLALAVPRADDLVALPRDLAGAECLDQLRAIANRIERDEAEALSPELRRRFGLGPAEVAPPIPPTKDSRSAEERPVQALILRGRGQGPIVRGVEKEPLNDAQFNTLTALLAAGERGLSKDELRNKGGHEDARGVLDRLRRKDADWGWAIQMAGKRGGRYRIAR